MIQCRYSQQCTVQAVHSEYTCSSRCSSRYEVAKRSKKFSLKTHVTRVHTTDKMSISRTVQWYCAETLREIRLRMTHPQPDLSSWMSHPTTSSRMMLFTTSAAFLLHLRAMLDILRLSPIPNSQSTVRAPVYRSLRQLCQDNNTNTLRYSLDMFAFGSGVSSRR